VLALGSGTIQAGVLAAAAMLCAACARRPHAAAEAPRLAPPLRVHTTSGPLWGAIGGAPSLLHAATPEQAEVVVSCREEAAFRRRWAFPAVLVNLLTLPVGFFTFTYRCTTTVTAEAEASAGAEKIAFREQATASGVFFQYQQQPEPGEPGLSPGFDATRRLARADLGRRLAARLAREWAQRHPERAVLPTPAAKDKGR